MPFGLQSRKRSLLPVSLSLIVACALVLFYNKACWAALLQMVPYTGFTSILFYGSFAFLLVAIINLLLCLVTFRWVLKPFLVVLLLCSATADYFMRAYGVAIDTVMIQNVFETNPGEITDLLSLKMVLSLLLLGVLPAVLVWLMPVRYPGVWQGWGQRLLSGVLSILVMVICVAPFYSTYAPIFREEDKLTHFINPTNHVYALGKYLTRHLRVGHHVDVKPIGLDSHPGQALSARDKPSLVILVVGETARADHFSLNGYGRNTNPELSQMDVLDYTDVHACGTSTAVSVPCMFSKFGRDDYSDSKGKSNENVLDMLQRAGITVFWRDNNSDCKGTCLRIPNDEVKRKANSRFCNENRCLDEVMLEDLQGFVDAQKGHILIVLHSDGSHGPEYFDRYPAEMEQFKPVCHTNELGSCTQEELVNVYDNTILYTDHFLAETIRFLQRNEQRFDTAMVYVSDHGESLGEDGLYLHGAPYPMAPAAQTHIPMITWFSPQAWQQWGIDQDCARRNQETQYTHDNLFHTLLGMFDIQSGEYRPALDMYRPCRH